MEETGTVLQRDMKGLGTGWTDLDSEEMPTTTPSETVFMLHKADPLVRSHASELKRRFDGLEVLQYLLIDGRFQGAVTGHWCIGPHDVEDIVLTLPKTQRAARQKDILRAVTLQYVPPFSDILKYDGRSL